MPSKQSSRPKLQPRTLLTGLAFGESPRWRHDRLWISDWGAREIIAVDPAGKSEVMARAPSFPSCIDFLRDGRLLMVSAYDGLLLRRQPDGSVVTHADLTGLSHPPWTDIVVDGRDNAYVNNSASIFAPARSSHPESSPSSVGMAQLGGLQMDSGSPTV